MQIKNTQPRLIVAPDVKPGFKGVRWLPGLNKLNPVYWEAIKSRPDIKRWMKLGWLEIVEDGVATVEATDLSDFSDDELRAALEDPSMADLHELAHKELAMRNN